MAQQRTMLTHSDIWNAVDRLAARAGLSASGLAKKAGLDPTTFNKSKRITPEGRNRWPSTESIAKSLQATGVTVDTFVSLITDRGGRVVFANEAFLQMFGYSGEEVLGRNARRLSPGLSDEWVRDTVSERAPTPGWPRTLAIVQDAAFHLYQRGAVDYGR